MHVGPGFQAYRSDCTCIIYYADISPNMAKTVCQQNLISLLHDDCVQYEEIRHEIKAPICELQAVTSDEILGNYMAQCIAIVYHIRACNSYHRLYSCHSQLI